MHRWDTPYLGDLAVDNPPHQHYIHLDHTIGKGHIVASLYYQQLVANRIEGIRCHLEHPASCLSQLSEKFPDALPSDMIAL